jgi:GAF domain-containing protein
LTNATNLCQANFGTLYLYEGDAFRVVAQHNAPLAYAELRQREPLVRARPMLRMAETKQVLHLADINEYVASRPEDKDAATFAKLSGVRTVIGVPMQQDDDVVGAIVIYRKEVRRFNDQEITLIKDFAAQAVIAIENARLLNELQQRTTDLTERTADLTEALEQQTATSDVLQVISSSPGQLEPVFATMLEKAVRICDANFGTINRWDGEALHLVASHDMPPAFVEYRKSTALRPGPESPVSRILVTKSLFHIDDLTTTQEYLHREPSAVAAAELGGIRAVLGVPLLRESEFIGVLFLSRREPRAFTDKQIELSQSFAAQAVIAIENARLVRELRESLEQQTAISEILQLINSSPGASIGRHLGPVFQRDDRKGNATV